MIRLTRLDGDVFFVNPDLIETIEETPDTHIMLSNGHRYLVLENTEVIVARIITYKATIMKRAFSMHGPRYLARKRVDLYRPLCALKPNKGND